MQSRNPDTPVQPSAAARAALADIIADVMRRRAAGERVTDEEIVARHPTLMPALGQELATLSDLRRAFLVARSAGPATGLAQVLSEEELESPITLEGDEADDRSSAPGDHRTGVEGVPHRQLPEIRGYELIAEIGAGGQATVFKAVHELTRRTVAIKTILGGPMANSRHRARFEQEIAILAGIDHPNIVNVIDRGCTADGSFYFVMNYVDGVPLDAYVERQGLRDPDKVGDLVTLWIKVSRAVQEAHRAGVVHRDLKPSNVLVDGRGEPHVMDFGLARGVRPTGAAAAAAYRTQTGQIVGSLPWASPEQINGDVDHLDARSDVYALGVMMYQSLAGDFPYPVDGNLAEVVRHITTSVPRAASTYRSGWRGTRRSRLGRRARNQTWLLDAVIHKALAKSPADRYATAGEMADDLENVLAGRSLNARHSPWEEWWRRRSHPRVITGGVMLALAMAFGTLALLAHRGGGGSPRASPRTSDAWTRPPTTVNTLGMRFVQIAPRRFVMGSSVDEEWRRRDELRHEVHLSRETWCGTTEVTQAQYRAVMETNPSDPRFLGDDLPVQNVTWDQAVEFCRRLSAREHRAYRLPTEAEWECACRSGSHESPTPNGQVAALAWCAANSGGTPHRVAQRPASPWGIYDMHGNVGEWCLDAYAPTYEADARAPVNDPLVASQLVIMRVVRGGDATSPEAECRASARGKRDPDARDPFVGFRVVMLGATTSAPATATAP